MKDIVKELRFAAETHVVDSGLTTLLLNAAAEIERLRSTLQDAHGLLTPDQSFSVMVKDLKHYLQGGDGGGADKES